MLFFICKLNKFHASFISGIYSSFPRLSHDRRAFLFSSSDGSLTVEAAISLPLYIFLLSAFIYILNILDMQNTLQIAMEEAYRTSNEHAYTYDELSSLLLIKTFRNDTVKDIADNSYIQNGHKGIRLIITKGDSPDDISFSIMYKVSLPFFPKKLLGINITQRCYFRAFTGESVTDKSGSYTQYVYVTATGSAYHTSQYCTYLSKYVNILPKSEFDVTWNTAGDYTPCPHCSYNTEISPTCFLCPESKVYHSRIDCIYLNVSIYKVPLDSIGSLPLCKRCRKGVH